MAPAAASSVGPIWSPGSRNPKIEFDDDSDPDPIIRLESYSVFCSEQCRHITKIILDFRHDR